MHWIEAARGDKLTVTAIPPMQVRAVDVASAQISAMLAASNDGFGVAVIADTTHALLRLATLVTARNQITCAGVGTGLGVGTALPMNIAMTQATKTAHPITPQEIRKAVIAWSPFQLLPAQ